MGEAKRRKEEGLPPRKKTSGFAEPTQSSKKQSKHHHNQDEIKEKQAITLLQAGKLEEAEKVYRDLIAKGSKNHLVYGNLAVIYLMRGDNKQGINLLKNALKLKPNDPVAHNNLGNALQEPVSYTHLTLPTIYSV